MILWRVHSERNAWGREGVATKTNTNTNTNAGWVEVEWPASYKCKSRKAKILCSRSPWTCLFYLHCVVPSLKFESVFPPKTALIVFPPKTALIGRFFPILFQQDIFQNVRPLPRLSLQAPGKIWVFPGMTEYWVLCKQRITLVQYLGSFQAMTDSNSLLSRSLFFLQDVEYFHLFQVVLDRKGGGLGG